MSTIDDGRHALRHLRQSPGYTLTAVLTFALGGPPRAWRTVIGVVSDVR